MGIGMMLRRLKIPTLADLSNLSSGRAVLRLLAPPYRGGYKLTLAAPSPVAEPLQICTGPKPITDDELRTMMPALVRMGGTMRLIRIAIDSAARSFGWNMVREIVKIIFR